MAYRGLGRRERELLRGCRLRLLRFLPLGMSRRRGWRRRGWLFLGCGGWSRLFSRSRCRCRCRCRCRGRSRSRSGCGSRFRSRCGVRSLGVPASKCERDRKRKKCESQFLHFLVLPWLTERECLPREPQTTSCRNPRLDRGSMPRKWHCRDRRGMSWRDLQCSPTEMLTGAVGTESFSPICIQES